MKPKEVIKLLKDKRVDLPSVRINQYKGRDLGVSWIPK